MKELKINPELRDFIPPLSGEEKKQLENSLLKYGYKGSPIYIWHDYIVDGHNRYELCKKHKIDYVAEELDLGDNASVVDVMEWMINTQLGRRNLPPAQRLAVMDKFKKKIQEQANAKKAESSKQFHGNQHKVVPSPNGEQTKAKIHTDKELAKLAGVGTGTVARYNKVMNSNDEELKKKVLANEVSINAGYQKIRKSEIQKENINNNKLDSHPKTYQEVAQLYGGTQQGCLPNRKNKETDDIFTDEQLVDALISTKTPVNVLDSIVPKQEFDIMANTLLENVQSCDYRIFDLHDVYKKMDDTDLDYAIKKFDSVINQIENLKEKICKAIKEK